MQNEGDYRKKQGRTPHGVLLSLAIGACVTVLTSECSRSHVQETVTVAPRTTVSPAPATTDAKSSSASPAVDAETEAAGDALAHAIVALKTRRREEALYYMNLARTRLTRLTRSRSFVISLMRAIIRLKPSASAPSSSLAWMSARARRSPSSA